ncbi:4'-phosphopantetheinyl transferase family protein [Streptomyces sp. NPDC090112]|uniref:4'-phosphopantetheinyl transferase family protein n=1 Tax=Streptomyces sp. NPDC090112 TaxID=3365949 RepID=UPI0037F74622
MRDEIRAGDLLDVWVLRLPPPGTPLSGPLHESELSEDERARGASFRRPADALRYRASHVALRRVLAPYAGIAPRDLEFGRSACPNCGGPQGRPVLAVPGRPVHFSLSHGAGLVAVAVASAPVGADVQRVPSAATVELCTGALHSAERAELARCPQDERRAEFARVWTRKEAYLKGIGTGLCRSSRLDYLGSDPARRPPGWTVHDLAADHRYGAAVAFGGPGNVLPTLRALSWDTLLRPAG